MATRVAGLMRDGFAFDRAAAFEPALMLEMMQRMLSGALLTLMPLFFALLVAAVAAPILLGGLVFAPKVLGLNLKCSGEVDLVMEAGAFSSRLAVEMGVRGVVYSLTPVGFVEGGDDFDIARYRIEPREPSSPGVL